MVTLLWDQAGEKRFKRGVDRGVLYKPTNGIYGPGSGVAWNGLTAVNEAPTGAEATPFYADNIKYANLMSQEDFACTIEAFYYPDAFAECEGSISPSAGVYVTQQSRKSFGFSWRVQLGDDLNENRGYEIHMAWGCLAAPSEKSNATINDTPELMGLSWEVSTTPVPINTPVGYKPSAHMVINSNQVTAAALLSLENALYGTGGADARLPLPEEVIAIFAGTQTSATPTAPTFVAGTGVITIPTVTGVQYRRADTNAVVTATVTVLPATPGVTLSIYAIPLAGYFFPPMVDDDWSFTRT